MTVSLTDDSEHKTAKVAAAWNHIASIEIHNFVISTLADLRSRPSRYRLCLAKKNSVM